MELTNRFTVGVPLDAAWSVLTDVERIAPCLPGAQLQEVDGDDYRGVVNVKVGPITAQYKGKATFVDRDDVRHVAVLKAEGRETKGQGNASATITASLRPHGEGTAVDVVTELTISGKVAQFGRGVLADVSSKLLDQFVECLETDLLAAPFAPAAATTDEPEMAPGLIAAIDYGRARDAIKEASAVAAEAEKVAAGDGGEEAPVIAGGAASDAWAAVSPIAAASAAKGQKEDRGEASPRKVDHREAPPIDLFDAAGVPMAKRAIPIVGGILIILWFLRRRRHRR